MSARDAILAAIDKAGAKAGAGAGKAALIRRIAAHRRGPQPDRADGDHAARVALFARYAEKAGASIARIEDMAAAPAAVADYLRRRNLPGELVMAPDATLDAACWQDQTLLEVRRGAPTPTDPVAVTSAFAGIAETGTIVTFSGPDHPATLNFMPATHILLLPVERVRARLEDVWDAVRADGAGLTRTVNLITGPSSSGDVEQTLIRGAHGPVRLHIILVGDA